MIVIYNTFSQVQATCLCLPHFSFSYHSDVNKLEFMNFFLKYKQDFNHLLGYLYQPQQEGH